MRSRKLRISWSVAWGVITVLLCVLWVQSSFKLTTVQVSVTKSSRYYVHSFSGMVALQVWRREFSSREFMPHFSKSDLESWLTPGPGVNLIRDSGHRVSAICIRYWIMTPVVLAAGLPWISFKQFSLRTLLFGITIIAILMGVIAWSIGHP